MALLNYCLLLMTVIFQQYLVSSTEFVPVYMWGTNKFSDRVPALHKTSQESFKDSTLEYLKKNPFILVFAEDTLSPEDFAQHSPSQNAPLYKNLLELKQESHVLYNPYVHNPIGAIKQLGLPVTELSISSLLDSDKIPEDNILIIDLDDAKDNEHRYHMLRRHDSDIATIYNDFAKKHENILVVYTAYHTSWVAPEELTHRNTRSLLADDPPPANDTAVKFQMGNLLMYLSKAGTLNITDKAPIAVDSTFTPTVNTSIPAYTLFELSNADHKIKFNFTNNARGYWYLNTINVTDTTEVDTVGLKLSNVYAPVKFSYHCGDLILRSSDSKTNLSFPGFQLQIFNVSDNITGRFGDAYDCVGFTSVPIWSGLFITAILLLIMTFGLTMMMDIKTMDRFDDAKGKTITINASE